MVRKNQLRRSLLVGKHHEILLAFRVGMFTKQAVSRNTRLQTPANPNSHNNVRWKEKFPIQKWSASGIFPVELGVDITRCVMWILMCSLVSWRIYPQGTGSLHLHMLCLSSRARQKSVHGSRAGTPSENDVGAMVLPFCSRTMQPYLLFFSSSIHMLSLSFRQ